MPRAEVPFTPSQDLDLLRRPGAPTDANGILTDDLVQFCQSGVSVVLGTRGLDGRPIAGLALACTISPGGVVRVLLRRPANVDLLLALASGAPIAATFTEPTTHRSIQLKGPRAELPSDCAGDLDAVARQTGRFRDTLVSVDYPRRMAEHYVGYRDEEIVAIDFRPERAFVQTPGPAAGSALTS
jgi:hypothetical protein